MYKIDIQELYYYLGKTNDATIGYEIVWVDVSTYGQ